MPGSGSVEHSSRDLPPSKAASLEHWAFSDGLLGASCRSGFKLFAVAERLPGLRCADSRERGLTPANSWVGCSPAWHFAGSRQLLDGGALQFNLQLDLRLGKNTR